MKIKALITNTIVCICLMLTPACAMESVQFPGGSVSASVEYEEPTAVHAEAEADYDFAKLACGIPYADWLIDCSPVVPEPAE